MSACFVYGYTRLFLSRLEFSADEVGLLLAVECGAAMLLQPVLARILERSARLCMRHLLLLLCAVALLCGGLLLVPQPRLLLVGLFAVMSLMTMTIQPFVNAVGFDYMNRGEKLNYSAARGLASLAFAAISYYGNARMADSEKVTGQALITGAISLSGVFSYLFGGMLVASWGAMTALLISTLIGMAGGLLFLLFALRDGRSVR